MGLPFVTWIMACFVRDLPDELLESATIDGCSRMGAFVSIVFPYAQTGNCFRDNPDNAVLLE
jgi:ABC-type glycerol-3-phosphate transport system permease component